MNTDDDFEVARQGSLDGLCGVYSIVNYFARLADLDGDDLRSASKKFLRLALATIEASDQLNSHNLLAGFWQGQLKKAADAVASKHADHVKVYTLASFARTANIVEPQELLRSLKGKGAAVLNLREPGHWVLAFSTLSSGLRYDDPAHGETRRLGAYTVAKRSIGLSKGLVLLHA